MGVVQVRCEWGRGGFQVREVQLWGIGSRGVGVGWSEVGGGVVKGHKGKR